MLILARPQGAEPSPHVHQTAQRLHLSGVGVQAQPPSQSSCRGCPSGLGHLWDLATGFSLLHSWHLGLSYSLWWKLLGIVGCLAASWKPVPLAPSTV